MIPNAICMLGLVAIAALYLTGQQAGPGVVTQANSDATPDHWQTPYYLRYNVPIPMMQMGILPTQAADTWSLATSVPASITAG